MPTTYPNPATDPVGRAVAWLDAIVSDGATQLDAIGDEVSGRLTFTYDDDRVVLDYSEKAWSYEVVELVVMGQPIDELVGFTVGYVGDTLSDSIAAAVAEKA